MMATEDIGVSSEAAETKTGAERRTQVRYPFRLGISCKALDLAGGTTWRGECRDLSIQGIRFVAERRFEPQTVLLIEIQSGADLPVRSFLGRVKWTERGPAAGWLMGCSLIHFMSLEEVEALVRQAELSGATDWKAPAPAEDTRPPSNSRLGRFVRVARTSRRSAEPGAGEAPALERVEKLLERAGPKSQEIRLPSRRASRTGSLPDINESTPVPAPTIAARPGSLAHTPRQEAPPTQMEMAVPEPLPEPEPLARPPVAEAEPPAPQGDQVAKQLLRQLTSQLDTDDFLGARATSLALLERNPGDPETLAVLAYLHDQLDASDKEGELRCFTGHGCTVNCVAFSPDGRTGYSGSGGDYVDGFYTDGDDRTLRVWDLAAGREVARFSEHSTPVLSVAGTPTGSHILTASRGGTLCLIDAGDVSIFRQLARHRSMVHALAIAPDGRTVLTACDDGVVRLWDLAGNRLCRFEGHSGPVTSVAFSPDGTWAASGGLDRTVRLWDLQSGDELRRFNGHEKGVLSVAIAPSGQLVLSGSSDGLMRLWDPEEGGEAASYCGHEGAVTAVAFTPNGQRALSGGRDATLRLWDVAGAVALARFTGHTGPIKSIAVSPGGRRALSGSTDTTVRLWGLPT